MIEALGDYLRFERRLLFFRGIAIGASLVGMAWLLVGCDNPQQPVPVSKTHRDAERTSVAKQERKEADRDRGYHFGFCSPCVGYHYDISKGGWTTGVSPAGIGFGF
jgi:hypothetical protein